MSGTGTTFAAAEALAPLRLLEHAEPLPRLAPAAVERAAVAEALALANQGYGHRRARELAERLADPATRVVVTGQQAGLFGGPLLAAVKAAAAVRWAEALEADGQPAVAVFWMATEDHDFEEVARAAWPREDGLEQVGLGADPSPLAPVGMRALGPAVDAALERLGAVSADPAYVAALARIGSWYRPAARFGEAFARLLVAVLGERSPLILDAQLPELKAASRPVLAAFVERREELAAATQAAEARLAAAGRTLQVRPQAGVSPLFLLAHGERRRIEWVGREQFRLRGAADQRPREVAELLEIVRDNPAVVSPGVLARPVVQDAVLGTALMVLGGAELSYLEQVAPSYRLLGVGAPAVVRRPSAVIVEAKQRAWMDSLGLDLETLLGDPAALASRLAEGHRSLGELAAVRAAVAAELGGLAPTVLSLEPQLERPWQRTERRVLGGLDRLAAKVAAAIVRGDELAARRIATLRGHLQPGGRPQERVVSVAWAWARWGDALGAALLDQLPLEPGALAEIVP